MDSRPDFESERVSPGFFGEVDLGSKPGLQLTSMMQPHIHRDLTRTTHCRYKSEADSKAKLSSTFTSSCPMFLLTPAM